MAIGGSVAGFVFPTLCLVFIWFASSLAATMISEAMSLVPGNERFDDRLEYATVVRHYFGDRSYMFTQVHTHGSSLWQSTLLMLHIAALKIVYNLSIQTINIASIVITAQVMDYALIAMFHKTKALSLSHAEIVTAVSTDGIPFEHDGLVISMGYMFSMVILLPMGFLTLDEVRVYKHLSQQAPLTTISLDIDDCAMHACMHRTFHSKCSRFCCLCFYWASSHGNSPTMAL
jgi:hypothetical protein